MTREYNLAAKLYDPLLYLFLNPIRKIVLAELAEHKDSLIIDLCCGTGNQLKVLEKNKFTALHCLDLSESMLEIAQHGTSKIKIYQADATKTDFADNTFDVGIISFAIHEKDRLTQEDLLKEAHRIIKQDGVLLIVDFDFATDTSWLAKSVINMIERIAGGEHYKNFVSYRENKGLNSLMQEDEYRLIKQNKRAFNSIAINRYQVV